MINNDGIRTNTGFEILTTSTKGTGRRPSIQDLETQYDSFVGTNNLLAYAAPPALPEGDVPLPGQKENEDFIQKIIDSVEASTTPPAVGQPKDENQKFIDKTLADAETAATPPAAGAPKDENQKFIDKILADVETTATPPAAGAPKDENQEFIDKTLAAVETTATPPAAGTPKDDNQKFIDDIISNVEKAATPAPPAPGAPKEEGQKFIDDIIDNVEKAATPAPGAPKDEGQQLIDDSIENVERSISPEASTMSKYTRQKNGSYVSPSQGPGVKYYYQVDGSIYCEGGTTTDSKTVKPQTCPANGEFNKDLNTPLPWTLDYAKLGLCPNGDGTFSNPLEVGGGKYIPQADGSFWFEGNGSRPANTYKGGRYTGTAEPLASTKRLIELKATPTATSNIFINGAPATVKAKNPRDNSVTDYTIPKGDSIHTLPNGDIMALVKVRGEDAVYFYRKDGSGWSTTPLFASIINDKKAEPGFKEIHAGVEAILASRTSRKFDPASVK